MSTGIELGTSRTEGRALTNCATLAPIASKGHNKLNHFHTFGTQLGPVYIGSGGPHVGALNRLGGVTRLSI